MANCNLLMLGKSGIGKSSLLNYMLGEPVAAVGIGRPVTGGGDKGPSLHRYQPLRTSAIDITIYDSWGMEADKADQWKSIIEAEISKRADTSKVSSWFHAAIYCVSVERARIEDFEFDEIIKPLIKSGVNVLFALTKADMDRIEGEESICVQLEKLIKQQCPKNVGIYKICSEVKQKRSGKVEPFGKEDLIAGLMNAVQVGLGERVALYSGRQFGKTMKSWKESVLLEYDKGPGFWEFLPAHMERVVEFADSQFNERMGRFNYWLIDALDTAARIYQGLGISISRNYTKLRAELGQGAGVNEKLTWKFDDSFTHYALSGIPLLNVLYVIFKKEMHRDNLSEQLDQIVSESIGRFEKLMPDILKQLDQVMLGYDG